MSTVEDEEPQELKAHHIGDLIKEVIADYNIEAAKHGNPPVIINYETAPPTPSAPTRDQ